MSQTQETKAKLYYITNRATKKRGLAVSDNAQDACKQLGWMIGDCFVQEAHEHLRRRKEHGLEPLVRVPTLTCPYQYAACKRPKNTPCSLNQDTPDLPEWLRVAMQAHLCAYVGEPLYKKDHALQQKWVTIEEAVKEFAPR